VNKGKTIKLGKRLALIKNGHDVFMVQKLRLPKAPITSNVKAGRDE
jgi:hypothetical protein